MAVEVVVTVIEEVIIEGRIIISMHIVDSIEDITLSDSLNQFFYLYTQWLMSHTVWM